jgi:RNA polymerase-binding protein DksA
MNCARRTTYKSRTHNYAFKSKSGTGEVRSFAAVAESRSEYHLARVREYRPAQEREAIPPPGDELDAAWALSDVETRASLMEQAEKRLRNIDFAFNLLERGRYGICAKCGDEIPLERLKAVPFATYCVDCQRERNHERRIGEGRLEEEFAAKWNLPEEMVESTET